ncbi:hypothetical protein Trydic_g7331 [Trypoxylus dichotomus]
MPGGTVRTIFFIFVYVLFEQYNAQTCTTTGRFPIHGTNCKYYNHCTYAGGVYYSTRFYCAGTTYFNPKSQVCAANFTCGDTFCAAALGWNRTADFLDPNISDNVSYITCVRYNETTTIAINSVCPVPFKVYNNVTKRGCCRFVTCNE